MAKKQNTDICKFYDVGIIDAATLRGKVDETLWLLTQGTQVIPVKVEDLLYLYSETTILRRRILSFPEYGKSRMDSIINTLKMYEPSDIRSYQHVIFLIQTSKEHIVSVSELCKLQDITIMFGSTAEIHWGIGIDEELNDMMSFMLVCSKK
jgi:hypothetical protein